MATTWVIIIGILVFSLLAWGVSALNNVGKPPVDHSGFEMPLSGHTSSGAVRAFEKKTRELHHANTEHETNEKLITWFLEWLKKLRIPFIDPEKKQGGILMLILILVVICIVSVGCIGSGLAGWAWNVAFPPASPTPYLEEVPGMPGVYQMVVPSTPTPEPTPAQPATPAVTEVATQFVVQPVSAPVSGQYFVVQVVHAGVIGKSGSWAPLSAGSESYYSLVTAAPCGTNVPLPKDQEVYALVDVNLPVYGPEVTGSDTGVVIACDGYNDNVLYVVIAP